MRERDAGDEPLLMRAFPVNSDGADDIEDEVALARGPSAEALAVDCWMTTAEARQLAYELLEAAAAITAKRIADRRGG